ncbi:MAG: hypothetical protein ACOYNL_00810 [Rickettsiales bacterium]
MIILIVAGIVIGVLVFKFYTDYRQWKLREAARKEQEIASQVEKLVEAKLAERTHEAKDK